MRIRKEATENGLTVTIEVTNQDLIETIEDAEKNNNMVVKSISKMPDDELEKEPGLLLMLLSSTAFLKSKNSKEKSNEE